MVTNSSPLLSELDTVINVILPLELYKHPLFPSEEAFDRLLATLQGQNQPATDKLCFTRNMLLAAAAIVSDTFPSRMQQQSIVLILRKLRQWRLIPLEDEERSTIYVACVLADIINNRSSENQVNALHINPSCNQLSLGEGKRIEQQEALEGNDSTSHVDLEPSTIFSASASSQLCADFRNGCSACRRPRRALVSPVMSPWIAPQIPHAPSTLPPIVANPSLYYRTPASTSAFEERNGTESSSPALLPINAVSTVDFHPKSVPAALYSAHVNTYTPSSKPKTPSKSKSRKTSRPATSRALSSSSAFNVSNNDRFPSSLSTPRFSAVDVASVEHLGAFPKNKTGNKGSRRSARSNSVGRSWRP